MKRRLEIDGAEGVDSLDGFGGGAMSFVRWCLLSLVVVSGVACVRAEVGSEVSIWYQRLWNQLKWQLEYAMVAPQAMWGKADAQIRLGHLYADNPTLCEDARKIERAAAWYEKAAAQGNSNARLELVWLYLKQDSIWCVPGADHKGVKLAAALVGEYPENRMPRHVLMRIAYGEDDYSKPWLWLNDKEWSLIMEDNNVAHPWKQWGQGMRYEMGQFRPGEHPRPDDGKAAIWYQKASNQGYAPAQYRLGRMYVEGRGVPKDMDKGLGLLRDAAEKGNAQAEAMLALMNNLRDWPSCV